MPLRYRHGYAAVLPRGLPAGDIDRRGSFQHHSGASAHRNPALIRQVRAGGSLEGRLTLVPCVPLPVPLAGPEPSDGAGLSRLCQGGLSPSPASPGIGLPSATSARCDGLKAVAFHHHTVKQRLVALDVGHPQPMRAGGRNTRLSKSWAIPAFRLRQVVEARRRPHPRAPRGRASIGRCACHRPRPTPRPVGSRNEFFLDIQIHYK